VRRLLFLGDSVTFGGSYVDDAAVFPAVAGRRLAMRSGGRVEALDGGVNAWGPQNVLGLVGPDGAFPDGFESDVWILTLLEDDFGRDKTRIAEVPYLNVAPRTAIEEVLVVTAYRLLGAYKRSRAADDLAAATDRNLEAIESIVRHAGGRGVAVLLVWHPAVGALSGHHEPAKARLAALAARTGTPLLDLGPHYAAQGGPGLYEDGMHLNAAGHAVAGEAIGDQLADLLLP
jgi:lysophospholipase L1-like esterase